MLRPRSRSALSKLNLVATLTSLPADLAEAIPQLLDGLRAVVIEDNRRGVLRQEDKDGNRMPDVTYRTGKATKAKGRKANFGVQNVGHYLGPELTDQAGNVLAAATPGNGNLTRKEYMKLTGGALAPRGERSRVIANLVTEWQPDGDGWLILGYWLNVISKAGVPFLKAHFTGDSVGKGHRVKLPVRDLRGVRPWGIEQGKRLIAEWAGTFLEGIAA